MIDSGFKYQGTVKLSVKDKPCVKCHNKGTYHLFNLIYNLFARIVHSGSDIALSVPSSISLITSPEVMPEQILTNPNYDLYKQYSILVAPVPIVDRHVQYDSDRGLSELNYVSLITHNDILTKSKELGYALLLNAKDEIIAFSQTDLITLEGIYEDATGQADIEWILSFSNAGEENNNE